MDSITQATLGAAVGEVLLGKKLGWKAAAWGAFFGTLPDLDILFSPFLSEAKQLYWHRGISHSFLMMIVGSLLCALPLARRYRNQDLTRQNAGWMIFWVWSTHVLIDAFTTYGTQIYEPFSDQRVALNNLFIIDPLFTVPLLIGLFIVLFRNPEPERRQRVMRLALAFSSLYVLFSFTMKFWALREIKTRLVQDSPQGKVIAVSPTTFNTILWRGLIEVPEGYLITYWSPFDEGPAAYDFLAKQAELVQEYEGEELLEALKWFSRDSWVARKGEDGKIIFIDMRFGEVRDLKSGSCQPIFQWHLERQKDDTLTGPMMRPKNLDYKTALTLTWKRLWGNRSAWESVKPF